MTRTLVRPVGVFGIQVTDLNEVVAGKEIVHCRHLNVALPNLELCYFVKVASDVLLRSAEDLAKAITRCLSLH